MSVSSMPLMPHLIVMPVLLPLVAAAALLLIRESRHRVKALSVSQRRSAALASRRRCSSP